MNLMWSTLGDHPRASMNLWLSHVTISLPSSKCESSSSSRMLCRPRLTFATEETTRRQCWTAWKIIKDHRSKMYQNVMLYQRSRKNIFRSEVVSAQLYNLRSSRLRLAQYADAPVTVDCSPSVPRLVEYIRVWFRYVQIYWSSMNISPKICSRLLWVLAFCSQFPHLSWSELFDKRMRIKPSEAC